MSWKRRKNLRTITRSVVMAGLYTQLPGLAIPPTTAATNGFVIPDFRGTAGATYSGWEVFSSAFGSGNSADLPGSSNTAILTQLDSNA